MSYEETEEGSRFIKRITFPKDRDPCLVDGHLWNVDADPGEPVTCIVCGEEYKMSRDERNSLRSRLEKLIQEKGESDGI